MNAPEISCNAMIILKKLELELISDADMYLLEFPTFLSDVVKPVISIENFISQTRIETYYILRRQKLIWLCYV